MAVRRSEAEIIVGVVSKIGIDTRSVINGVSKILREYGYSCVEIKITDAIFELTKFSDIDVSNTESRYRELIRSCNSIRESLSCQDVMARFAISRILYERKIADPEESRSTRVAYIVSQLKKPEESNLLRSIYGEQYVQIACHAGNGARETRLAQKISNDHPRKPKGADWRTNAQELMRVDEVEEDNDWGQRLRDVFPLSDIIIDAESERSMMPALDRFFRALFGDPRVTPTSDEYGMQLARTASLRSSDLSRQVGAAILNRYNEVQALGCNEVPRAGGGTYWEGDGGDAREFQLGRDSNDERKREVLNDLLNRLSEIGVIRSDFNDPGKLQQLVFDRKDKIISDAQIMDSLEYGRTIHAEMNAITDAARGGHSVRNCILYCNTFPCHNCAKHIVASGIVEVVYSIPYPKSYAEELFPDSIVVDPDAKPAGRVTFRQFIGISGPIFGRVFEKRKWKNSDGSVPPFSKRTATFVQKTPAPAYAHAEEIVAEELAASLNDAGLAVRRPPEPSGSD